MLGLAVGLAKRGHLVTYVAVKPLDEARLKQGWEVPEHGNIHVIIQNELRERISLLKSLSAKTIHIVQGLAGEENFTRVLDELEQMGASTYATFETVDPRGLKGILRKVKYSAILRKRARKSLSILSIGWTTRAWLSSLGYPNDRIFDFTYFLPQPKLHHSLINIRPSQFLFAGSLIQRKRPLDIISAIKLIESHGMKTSVAFIGDGPLRGMLEQQKLQLSSSRIELYGTVKQSMMMEYFRSSECLILPSAHDGWGAVVSEALQAGTRVICSNRCGASQVAKNSGAGLIFNAGKTEELASQMIRVIQDGPVQKTERQITSTWAECISAESGAAYLESIFLTSSGEDRRIPPPWTYVQNAKTSPEITETA